MCLIFVDLENEKSSSSSIKIFFTYLLLLSFLKNFFPFSSSSFLLSNLYLFFTKNLFSFFVSQILNQPSLF